MKNLLVLIAGLVMVSSPALASRARLESLQEGKNGSYFIKDNRNVFLNPATIADFKHSFNLELGKDSNTADTSAAPIGQANYIGSFGDYSYLVSLGNESDTTKNLINGFGGTGFLVPDRYLELGVAGGADLKYGLNLLYAGASKNTGLTKSANQLAARFGVGMNDFNFFGTVGLITKAKGATLVDDEFKGKIGLDLAATYGMGNFTYFVNFVTTGADHSVTAGKDKEYSATQIAAGLGHHNEVAKGVSLFSKANFAYSTNETKTGTAGGALTSGGKDKTWSIPLTLGVEADATSWLALRGSISQNLLGQHTVGGNSDSMLDTTTIATGAGFKFGNVTIDASVATAAATFGFDANMLSRLSMNVAF